MSMEQEEIKSWSARPFVSHSGPDEKGYRQEVLVTKGVGTIKKIEDEGTTAKVTITVEGMKHPFGGWINTDTDAFRIAKQQYENNAPIAFRVEHQRRLKNTKTNVEIPKETPINELMGADENGRNPDMQLTGQNTKKLLVGLGIPNGEMFFSQELTDPNEDPQFGGNKPSSARVNKTPAQPQAVQTDSVIPNGVETAYAALTPQGNVNIGSYGVRAPIELYFWLSGKEEDGSAPQLNQNKMRMLSQAMLSASGEIQLDLYYGELSAVDRQAASFKTIVDTMKSVVEHITPLTDEDTSSAENIQKWMEKIKEQTEKVIKWGTKDAGSVLNAN